LECHPDGKFFFVSLMILRWLSQAETLRQCDFLVRFGTVGIFDGLQVIESKGVGA
jgi:hypothetical protein